MGKYSEVEQLFLSAEKVGGEQETLQDIASSIGVEVSDDDGLPENPKKIEAEAAPEIKTEPAKIEDVPVSPTEAIEPGQAPKKDKSFKEELSETLESFAGQEIGMIKSGAGAALDMVEALGNTAIDITNYVDGILKEKGFTSKDLLDDDLKIDFAQQLLPDSEDPVQQLQRGILGYILPFAAGNKLLSGVKYANTPYVKEALAAAVASFVAIDPEEGNLGNLIDQNPDMLWPIFMTMLEPLSEITKIEEEDSPLMRRSKNAFESIVIDTIFLGTGKLMGKGMNMSEAIYKTVRGARKARKFTGKEAKILKDADFIKAETDQFEAELKADVAAGKKRVSTKDLGLKSDQSLAALEKSPNAFKAVSSDIKKNVDELNEFLPNPKSDKQVAKEADELLKDPEIQELLAKKVKAGEVLSDAEVKAAAEGYVRHFQLVEVAVEAYKAAPTTANGLILEKILSNQRTFREVWLGSGPAGGRALRQRKV